MSEHLNDAKAGLDAFGADGNPEQLESAIRSLEQVDLFEPAPAERLATRRELGRAWLQVMATLKSAQDPAFDPDDRPRLSVAPPGTNSGHIPGVAPQHISKPEIRTAYEEAARKNSEKAARYHGQSRLRFLENRATEGLERFVRRFYSIAQPDRDELAGLFEETGTPPELRERLRALRPN